MSDTARNGRSRTRRRREAGGAPAQTGRRRGCAGSASTWSHWPRRTAAGSGPRGRGRVWPRRCPAAGSAEGAGGEVGR